MENTKLNDNLSRFLESMPDEVKKKVGIAMLERIAETAKNMPTEKREELIVELVLTFKQLETKIEELTEQRAAFARAIHALNNA